MTKWTPGTFVFSWWSAEADAQADLRVASATADRGWRIAMLTADKNRITAENNAQKAYRNVQSNAYHASQTTWASHDYAFYLAEINASAALSSGLSDPWSIRDDTLRSGRAPSDRDRLSASQTRTTRFVTAQRDIELAHHAAETTLRNDAAQSILTQTSSAANENLALVASAANTHRSAGTPGTTPALTSVATVLPGTLGIAARVNLTMPVESWFSVVDQVIDRMEDWVEDRYGQTVDYDLYLKKHIPGAPASSNGFDVSNAYNQPVNSASGTIPSRNAVPVVEGVVYQEGSEGDSDDSLLITDSVSQNSASAAVSEDDTPSSRSQRLVNAPELSASERILDFSDAFRASYPSYRQSSLSDAQMVAERARIEKQIATLTLLQAELQKRGKQIQQRYYNSRGRFVGEDQGQTFDSAIQPIRNMLSRVQGALGAALAAEHDLVHTVNARREAAWRDTVSAREAARHGMPSGQRMQPSTLDAKVDFWTQFVAMEVITVGLGKVAHLRHLGQVKLAAKASDDVVKYVDNIVGTAYNAPVRVTGDALAAMRKAFGAAKPQAWMDEAAANASKYTAAQLERMKKGLAPLGDDGFPMEIHHIVPLAEGGTNLLSNFQFLTRTLHRLGPNYKLNHPNLP